MKTNKLLGNLEIATFCEQLALVVLQVIVGLAPDFLQNLNSVGAVDFLRKREEIILTCGDRWS